MNFCFVVRSTPHIVYARLSSREEAKTLISSHRPLHSSLSFLSLQLNFSLVIPVYFLAVVARSADKNFNL